jgi:hypothetical protein
MIERLNSWGLNSLRANQGAMQPGFVRQLLQRRATRLPTIKVKKNSAQYLGFFSYIRFNPASS